MEELLVLLPEVGEKKIVEVKRQLSDPRVRKVSDFDYTLFDTTSFHEAANPQTFSSLKVDLRTFTPETIAHARGMSDMQALRFLAPDASREDLLQAVERRKKKLDELVDNEKHLEKYFMPGMDDFVRYMRKTGQKVGIASSNYDSFIKKFVQKCELDGKSIQDVFPQEAVVGETMVGEICERNKLPSLLKPSAFPIYLSAMSTPGARGACEILYFGDSQTDVDSAKGRAGIAGVIFNANGYEKMRNRSNFENIIFLSSVKEILPSGN